MKTGNPLGLQVFDVAEYLDSEELIAEFVNSVLQKSAGPVRARTARKAAQPKKKRVSHEVAAAPAARK